MPGLLTRFTIFLMASLWMNALISQQELPIIRSFTAENGFPDNDVRWITQDSLGFLWIATWDGLVRYDGVEFITYRHDPNVASSLGYFEVSMIIPDKFNHIWIRTGTKLCRYNPAGDDFIVYNQAKITSGIYKEKPEYFQTILADPDHVLHVKYGREFYRYNNATDSFSPVKIHSDETNLSEINYAAFDDAGFLWLFELFSVKEYSKAFRLQRQDSLNYSLAGVYMMELKHLHEFPPNFTFRIEIFNAPEGNTWMASNRGLYTISGDTVRLVEEFIPGSEFNHRNLVVWYQMQAGLIAWYKGKSLLVSETGSKDGVAAFFVDSQQNIWFSRIDSLRKKTGLELTFRADNYFHQYFHKNDNRIPLNVFGLVEDRQGTIWAGGHPNTTLAMISSSDEIVGIPLMFDKEDYYNFPRCMASDEKGMIWMASYDDYLYRFDPVSQSFEDCSDKGILRRGAYDKPRYRIVKTISNGKMILCGNGCIHKIDYDFRGQSSFHPDIRHIYSVYEDSAGWLWCGGIGRLIRLSPDLSALQTFEI
ncbi:MAG: two-component regulator propeller domain-containing protein, partial [Bacteroidales bacterium]|nr:two-component regulator propeller domain-containing protein [Bacteroidales bacterium]